MRHCISSMLLLRLARGLRGPARPVARLVPTRAAATGDWLGHRSDPSVPASGPRERLDRRALQPTTIRTASPRRSRSCRRVHAHAPAAHLGAARFPAAQRRPLSRKLANEMARLLEVLGCEVRSFDPSGICRFGSHNRGPPESCRVTSSSGGSEGHVWVSPRCTVVSPARSRTRSTGCPSRRTTCVDLQVNGAAVVQRCEIGEFLRNIAWTFVSLHAIEPTWPRGQCRVDGVECTPSRRRSSESTSRRWRGAPEI